MMVDVGEQHREANCIASRHERSVTAWTRRQFSIVIEEAADEIQSTQRGYGADIRLRTELDESLGGAEGVVGQRDVEDVSLAPIGDHRLGISEIQPRAALEQQIDE